MATPGADPDYPPYGRGTGQGALAVGPAAFEVPPEPALDVQTSDGYTRRRRRANRQELGFEPDSATGYAGLDLGSTAAAEVTPPLSKVP